MTNRLVKSVFNFLELVFKLIIAYLQKKLNAQSFSCRKLWSASSQRNWHNSKYFGEVCATMTNSYLCGMTEFRFRDGNELWLPSCDW